MPKEEKNENFLSRKKYKGSKGYRLHLKRFEFSHKQGIRTIKFPLGEYDEKSKKIILTEDYKEFAGKIKKDYESLYGPLNILSYKENPEMYSLKEFWVDCLRSGMIMMPKSNEMRCLIGIYEGTEKDKDKKQKELMKKKNKEFFDMIDFQKFKEEFILSDPKRPKQNTEESIIKNFTNIVKEVKDVESNQSLMKYGEEFYEVILNRGDQKSFLEKKFGVDFSIYSSENNLSYYFFPDLELDKEITIEKCLERIDEFIGELGLDAKDKKIKDYVGIGDNGNGVSQIFNVFFNQLIEDGGVENLMKKISQKSKIWDKKSKDLEERLKFLSLKAKKLGNPKLVDGWHQYRSDIVGKIASWVSNAYSQDKEIKKQLFGYEKEYNKKTRKCDPIPKDGHKQEKDGHKQELEKVLEELKRESYQKETLKEQKEKIIELVMQMKNLLFIFEKTYKDKNIPINHLQGYKDILSDFKATLNFLFQEVNGYYENEEDIKTKKGKKLKSECINTKFPILFKELRTPPSFIGDVKIKQKGVYDKYFNSVERLKEGINFLESTYTPLGKSKKIDNQDKIKYILQSVVEMHRNAQSEMGRNISEKIIKEFGFQISVFTDGVDNKNYIYRNKRAREKRGEDFGKKLKETEYIEKQNKLLLLLSVNWGKHKKLDIKNWLDLVAIEKIRFGLLAQMYDISTLEFSNELKEHYQKIDVICSRFNQKNSKNANFIVQQAILSEMKGTLSKMSTEKYIMRYVILAIESEKKFPLISNLWSAGKVESGHRYYISKNSLKGKNKNEENAAIISEKKFDNLKNVFVEKDKLFKIQTSKTQLQFLDKAFSGVWEKYSPILSSYSFIFEENYSAKWDNNGVNFKKINDKLFVSIPFKLGFNKKSEKINKKLTERAKLLGVDIGEYGVAMYLLDTKDFKNVPYTSFLYEPQIKRIRNGIKENKKSQKAGTFSIPSSKVKEIRQHAITIIRNRIHDIVIENDARPVYEKEVSAFESGSGKISKIYHSIKRSDVNSESNTDQLDSDLVWGKSSKSRDKDSKLRIGKDVRAYATSYMCSACYKSVYAYISKEDYKKDYEILEVNDSKKNDKTGKWEQVIVFSVDSEKIKGYIESEKELKVGEFIEGKKVQNAIKKYARPPIKIFLKRHKGEDVFKKCGINKDDFESIRGSQAIYVCPFCNEISDADIQAAMWIALKGWLNLHISTNKPEREYFKDKDIEKKWMSNNLKEKLIYLMEYAKNKKIPHIKLKNNA